MTASLHTSRLQSQAIDKRLGFPMPFQYFPVFHCLLASCGTCQLCDLLPSVRNTVTRNEDELCTIGESHVQTSCYWTPFTNPLRKDAIVELAVS